MARVSFDWDPRKAAANLRKKRVSFEEAQTVLDDPAALWEFDAAHSGAEDRFRVIGYSDRDRLLVVTVADRAGRFRVVSARRATKRERYAYESR